LLLKIKVNINYKNSIKPLVEPVKALNNQAKQKTKQHPPKKQGRRKMKSTKKGNIYRKLNKLCERSKNPKIENSN